MESLKSKRSRQPHRDILSGIVFSVLVASALAASHAQADTLTDLRTTLQGLDSHATLQGVLEVQSATVKGKSSPSKMESAHLQLGVQTGDGLSLHLAPTLLQQVDEEKASRDADPDKPAPTADLLDQVSPSQVENIVSVAPMLLRILSRAEAPVIKPVTFGGEPAQELTVKLPPAVSKKDSSGLKDFQADLSVWLDTKGTPLAYQQSLHAKGCKFFLCITFDQLENGTLQVIDGRLVAVILSQEHKQSGLGQDSDVKTTYTLHVTPATGSGGGRNQ